MVSIFQDSRQGAVELSPALWDHDAVFRQQAAHLVDQRGAAFYQLLPDPVKRLHLELGSCLDWHEAHRWAPGSLADRLGIVGVVLVGFDVGLYQSRTDQPYAMTQLLDLARPIMRARAGFHRHRASRQLGDEGQQLPARELFA